MKKKDPSTGVRGFGPNREQRSEGNSQQNSSQVRETENLVEETLEKFGVKKRPRLTKEALEDLGPYDRLVSRFGATTLQSFENGLLWTSSTMVIILVLSGIVLSADAFLHSTSNAENSNNVFAIAKDIVDDATVKIVQPLFTPLIVLFFFASITLGILKSLQLTSSKTVYRE